MTGRTNSPLVCWPRSGPLVRLRSVRARRPGAADGVTSRRASLGAGERASRERNRASHDADFSRSPLRPPDRVRHVVQPRGRLIAPASLDAGCHRSRGATSAARQRAGLLGPRRMSRVAARVPRRGGRFVTTRCRPLEQPLCWPGWSPPLFRRPPSVVALTTSISTCPTPTFRPPPRRCPRRRIPSTSPRRRACRREPAVPSADEYLIRDDTVHADAGRPDAPPTRRRRVTATPPPRPPSLSAAVSRRQRRLSCARRPVLPRTNACRKRMRERAASSAAVRRFDQSPARPSARRSPPRA